MQRLLVSVFGAVFLGALAPVAAARAQAVASPTTIYEMPLPGGLDAALAATGDRLSADRSQFLVDLIRRSYESASGVAPRTRLQFLQPFLAHVARAGKAPDAPSDTLPLPLAPAIWQEAILPRPSSTGHLVSDIVSSHGASLLYCGLLALDDETRAWLGRQPTLLTFLANRHAAAFAVSAPGIRMAGATLSLPGGEQARPLWETLAGGSASNPDAFIRALVSARNGRIAHLFGVVSRLRAEQAATVLKLQAADPVDGGRRLAAIFERLAPNWTLDERPFWRPLLDPVLLASDLPTVGTGEPLLPGTRAFWTAAFASGDPRSHDTAALVTGEPVDFPWLAEQVFHPAHAASRGRYQVVLFGSRLLKEVRAESVRDAIVAVRASAQYPALTAALERGGLTDLAVYAAAARRAGRLLAIGDGTRAARALAQFQGVLAVLARAAHRGALTPARFAAMVASLSTVEQGPRGDYEGRLALWIDATLGDVRQPAASRADSAQSSPGASHVPLDPLPSVETALIELMAGRPAAEPPIVEWEGTRYRVDVAGADARRVSQMLGDHSTPYVSAAVSVAKIADRVSDPGLTREQLAAESARAEDVVRSLGTGEDARDASPSATRSVAALDRLIRERSLDSARRMGTSLRQAADDLLATGLTELAYAAAMGRSDRTAISAVEAASRHDIGVDAVAGDPGWPWRNPTAGPGRDRDWRVIGSLLNLDVRLAELSMIRMSVRPPAAPSLKEADRRPLFEAAVLVPTTTLTDADRDAVSDAVRRGRASLSAVRTVPDADAVAGAVGLDPLRRTLLAWIVRRNPERISAFLSVTELLTLGMNGRALPTAADNWGAPAEARLGCLCLRMPRQQPRDLLTGRWESGILLSDVADLNLRLAELLTELRMPASLLGPVLSSATLDMIHGVTSRHQDDRRALAEYVSALQADRLEQYLAFLTTDGPLVPLDDVDRDVVVSADIQPRTGRAR